MSSTPHSFKHLHCFVVLEIDTGRYISRKSLFIFIMANTKTVHVPHLGGIDAGLVTHMTLSIVLIPPFRYQMPFPYKASKPTMILVNSFTTSSELYTGQFDNKALTDKVNLLAIELLGHGKTRTASENFTYWDTAIMNLQVMEALDIKKAFVLGTSQGGWITVRMALLAPDKIEGIIPLGTSMDYESERTRKLGCWDGAAACTGPINNWTTTQPTPDFQPDEDYCNFLIDIGFGKDITKENRDFWVKTIQGNYQGDHGRRRARMAAINLRERDGLHGRLFDVRCPVMWLHGTADVVYSVSNAQQEIELFTNARSAELITVPDGAHFLSASHPEVVDQAILNFVGKWANKHI